MTFSGMLQNWLTNQESENSAGPTGSPHIAVEEPVKGTPVQINPVMSEIPAVSVSEIQRNTEGQTSVVPVSTNMHPAMSQNQKQAASQRQTPTTLQTPTIASTSPTTTTQTIIPAEDQAGETGGDKKAENGTAPGAAPKFEFDRYLLGWLREVNTSFFISSYKTHKVFSIGVVKDSRDNQDKLSLWMTQFNRPMGVHAGKKTIWVSSSGNLWRFDNSGSYEEIGSPLGPFDANYLPRMAYFSNDIDTHDVCVDANDNPYYVSALFCCVCVPAEDHSFRVYWKPPWVSKVAPEDRCHLNGICARDGEPRYVSSVCMLDCKAAWRENRIGKGILYDIKENKLVCEGLTMPHSPRWHNGKLWVLESGTGWFGYADMEKKEFVRKVWLAGYLRGLSFVGSKYAVIGSSEDRHENTFQGLPLGDELTKHGVSAKCGMFVINLETFDVVHNLIFYSPTNELYDVCAVSGIRRPKMNEAGDEKNMREYKIDHGLFAPTQ